MKTRDPCREHRISVATFYSWKQKFGGLDVKEAQWLSVFRVLFFCVGSRTDAG